MHRDWNGMSREQSSARRRRDIARWLTPPGGDHPPWPTGTRASVESPAPIADRRARLRSRRSPAESPACGNSHRWAWSISALEKGPGAFEESV